MVKNMYTQGIREGDRVQITPANQKNSLKPYLSKVEMVDNSTVLAYSPFINWDFVRLPVTELYWLCFMENMLRHNASINKHVLKEGFQFVEFSLLDEGESLQKREYERFSCYTSTHFSLLGKGETGKQSQSDSHNGIICNMSGGGMRIITRQDMELEDRIVVNVRVFGEDLQLPGDIRVKYKDSNTCRQFQYGVEFSDISDIDRDKIIRYLLRQQKIVP